MMEKKSGEYKLMRAKIAYQENGRPHLIKNIEWVDYDTAPDFPELQRFLDIFSSRLDGAIDEVRLYEEGPVRPQNMIYAESNATIH